ncbi:hypothetical protein [Parasphingorhabdus sp.]|uniref:hypothetical protein n=1 Tax=Parasphingorhabdus sp. TaxID=2709688 RepID=UPI002F93E1A5
MTQKNDDIFRLRSLAIEKQQARDTLRKDLSDTKERLRPTNLIQEAKNKTLDQVQKTGEGALQGMKNHPGKVASVAAVAALVALRKPLAKHYTNRKSANSGDAQNDAEE